MTTKTKPTEPRPFSITDLIEGTFPYQYTFPVDSPFAGLSFCYRELNESIIETLVEKLSDDFRSLGFVEPLPAIYKLFANAKLTGEEYLTFSDRYDALTTWQRNALAEITRRGEGIVLASVLGSWNAPEAITPELCAKLPNALKNFIMNKAGDTHSALIAGDN